LTSQCGEEEAWVVGAYCALVSWHILNNERIEMRKNTDLASALQAFHSMDHTSRYKLSPNSAVPIQRPQQIIDGMNEVACHAIISQGPSALSNSIISQRFL
jgi:hypothetical protein